MKSYFKWVKRTAAACFIILPLYERMMSRMSKRTAAEPHRRVNPFVELWRNKFLYLLALPAVIYTFVYCYMSLPYIAIAFEKFNYKKGLFSDFVGLKNFEYFFKSSWAWTVTRNTLVINILFLVVGTVCAVALAIVLNEVHAKRFLKVSQSAMLFPYFISCKRIRYITLPLLMPTICILTLMSIGRIFYGDFGMLYAIVRDNSSLMPIAEVIDTYVYRTFKNTGDPSLSMAIGLYQSIVGFILVFTSNWIVRRNFPEGALF